MFSWNFDLLCVLLTTSLRFFLSYYRHCVKSVQIWSYFWSISSCIQSKNRKIQVAFIRVTIYLCIKFSSYKSNTAWKVSKLNTGKYGSEITPYLDTFHAMRRNVDYTLFHKQHQTLAKNQAKAKQYREAEPLLFEFFFFMHSIIRKWEIF